MAASALAGPGGRAAAASPVGVAIVRLLIDANLSPRVAVALSKAGLESVHVCDVGAIVTIARGRMRIRSLPIVPAD